MTDHECRCGRLAGLTIEKLMAKPSCTDRFVCPRLDKARRTHPKFNEYLNRHSAAKEAA
jgi:hypothetical protein